MISSIKHRLFMLLGVFTMVFSLLFFTLMIVLAYVVEDEIIEKLLEIESVFMVGQYQEKGLLVSPRNSFMEIHLSSDTLPEGVGDALNLNPRTKEIFTPSASHFHLRYVALTPSKSIILLADVTPLLVVTNMSRRVLVLFLCVFVFVLFTALFVAYCISQFTAKPITDLSIRLKQYQDEGGVLSLPSYKGEVGYLSKVIEGNMQRLQKLVDREKCFTRDVSHELRTPLTVIKNTLLLSNKRSITHDEMISITKASNDIENTVEVLLSLAREEVLLIQSCNLSLMVEQVLLDVYQIIEEKQINVEVQVCGSDMVFANDQLLRLLLRNLTLNAVDHNEGKFFRVSYTDKVLTFANTLKKADDISSHNFLRSGVKGVSSKGLGNGLFLVSRIVEAIGWSVTITQSESVFSVMVTTKQ